MKFLISLIAFTLSFSLSAQNYLQTSQNLLRALKNGQDASPFVRIIADANPQELAAQIDTDQKRLAFWINLYNGLIQYKLKQNPGLYEDRGDFFGDNILTVAGSSVSFDNIEHGVLRRGTSKYSYGYFKNPFGGDWHKPYMVDEIDWRIHFALNCGASSCPPVRIYDEATINSQLNESTQQYLQSQVRYNADEKQVHLPKLMDWFSGDFGGEDGALEIVKNRGFITSTKVSVDYNDYDWTLKIGPGVFYQNDWILAQLR